MQTNVLTLMGIIEASHSTSNEYSLTAGNLGMDNEGV